MENLARIISHGFAIVVVVLLGVGFIYRGELFPELELPDFLVPESAKTADVGTDAHNLQSAKKVAPEPPAGEPGGQASPGVTSVVGQTTGANTGEPEVAAEVPSPPAAEQAGTTLETEPVAAEPTATAGSLSEETSQAPVGDSQSAIAEAPVPPVGTAGREISATTAANPTAAPVPQSADQNQGESPVEVPASGTGSQSASDLPQSPPDLDISPEMEPRGSVETAGAGEQPAPARTGPEETDSASGAPSSHAAAPLAAPPSESAAPDSARSAETTAAQATPYELLAAAREAFWMHNYDDAEKNYRALIALEPDDPDGYGELGNMYFSQGRWDEAAASYYEAGSRLVSEGRLDPARELVNVIRGLNGTQADALDKLINAAAAGSDN